MSVFGRWVESGKSTLGKPNEPETYLISNSIGTKRTFKNEKK